MDAFCFADRLLQILLVYIMPACFSGWVTGCEPVDIFVNNRLIAHGEVVMIDNSLGVTLTEIVRPER